MDTHTQHPPHAPSDLYDKANFAAPLRVTGLQHLRDRIYEPALANNLCAACAFKNAPAIEGFREDSGMRIIGEDEWRHYPPEPEDPFTSHRAPVGAQRFLTYVPTRVIWLGDEHAVHVWSDRYRIGAREIDPDGLHWRHAVPHDFISNLEVIPHGDPVYFEMERATGDADIQLCFHRDADGLHGAVICGGYWHNSIKFYEGGPTWTS